MAFAAPMYGASQSNKAILAMAAFYVVMFSGVGYLMWWDQNEPKANQQKLSETLRDIDQRPSLVFNSTAACEAQGFGHAACEQSQGAARLVAERRGTRLETGSSFDCAQRYGHCGTIEGAKGSKTYYPLMVGWQAAANDLGKAVPLFSTQNPDEGIRGDGKILVLKQ